LYQCPKKIRKHQFPSKISLDITYIFFSFYQFRATNVAEDINNHDHDSEDIITSEFIIISSDEQSEAGNNVLTSSEVVTIPSTTEKETDSIKISSKDQKKRKGGPNAKTVYYI
jgi:hypothetical protein